MIDSVNAAIISYACAAVLASIISNTVDGCFRAEVGGAIVIACASLVEADSVSDLSCVTSVHVCVARASIGASSTGACDGIAQLGVAFNVYGTSSGDAYLVGIVASLCKNVVQLAVVCLSHAIVAFSVVARLC